MWTPNAISDRLTVYFGTVLLEANRWTQEKIPTFKVSAWAGAIRDAGFAGLELWENHADLADAAEQEALGDLPLPVVIFNSYCAFDDAGAAVRARAVDWAWRFGAQGVKFNLGNEPARADEYLRNLCAWAEALPAGRRLLCECHSGTILEEPAAAARLLAPLAGRVEIIVHPCSGELATLRQWFERFGPAITHVHVAGRRGAWPVLRLTDMAAEARARIAFLRSAGYAGTWTVECTAGIQQPPEDRHVLLARATADLAFPREQF